MRRIGLPLSTFIVATAFAMSGCASSQRVARMERRLDSLAVTLTTVVGRMQNAARPGDPNPPRDTATVSTQGVAALGDPAARVVVVEFTDYQCPFCRRHFLSTLPSLQKAYITSGKVRYVVRDLPLTTLHPMALRAAEAARCVMSEDPAEFWSFREALFRSQARLSPTLIRGLARAHGFRGSLETCAESVPVSNAIARDSSAAARVGLRSTPSFVVGVARPDDSTFGKVIRGAYPFNVFRAVIDSLLGQEDNSVSTLGHSHSGGAKTGCSSSLCQFSRSDDPS